MRFEGGYNPDQELAERLSPEKIAIEPAAIAREARALKAEPKLERESKRLPRVEIEGATIGKDPARENQDAILTFTDPETGFFVAGILDGVGGHQGGAFTSHKLRDTLKEKFEDFRGRHITAISILEGIRDAMKEFKDKMDRMSAEFADSDTTMSIAFGLPKNGETEVFVANVGDSPIYRNQGGVLQKVSEDDSLVEELRRKGEISDLAAKVHPQRNIITYSARNLPEGLHEFASVPDFPVHLSSFVLREGDEILIVSDGLSDQFREDAEYNEIQNMVNDKLPPAEMIAAARIRTRQEIEDLSKNDDISVVKVKLLPRAPQPTPSSGLARNFEPETQQFPNPAMALHRERRDYRITTMYEKIMSDKHLASYVAQALYENFTYRNRLTLLDMVEFYRQYPTRESFQFGFELASFLRQIERDNGPAKRQEYAAAFDRFLEEMY